MDLNIPGSRMSGITLKLSRHMYIHNGDHCMALNWKPTMINSVCVCVWECVVCEGLRGVCVCVCTVGKTVLGE